MNDTKNSVEVVYSMAGYEQRGSVPTNAVIYPARVAGGAPVPFSDIITAGDAISAAEWECREEDGDAPAGAYIRHGDRAIPVRLVTGGAL